MKKYGFGVDVGGTTIKMGFFETSGRLISKWEIKTNTEDGGENQLYRHTERGGLGIAMRGNYQWRRSGRVRTRRERDARTGRRRAWPLSGCHILKKYRQPIENALPVCYNIPIRKRRRFL